MTVSEHYLRFLEGDSRYGCERWHRDRTDSDLLAHLAQAVPRSLAGERAAVGVKGKEGYTFLAEEVVSHVCRSRPGALLVRVLAPPRVGDDLVVGFFGVAGDDGNQGLWDGFEKVEGGTRREGEGAHPPAAPWVRLHIALQPSGFNVTGWSVMKWGMATMWLGDFARAAAWAWLDTLPERQGATDGAEETGDEPRPARR